MSGLWHFEWLVEPGPVPASSVEQWSWVNFAAMSRLLNLSKPWFPHIHDGENKGNLLQREAVMTEEDKQSDWHSAWHRLSSSRWARFSNIP